MIKDFDLDEWRTIFEERQSLINEIDTILEDIKEDQDGNITVSSLKKEPVKELEIKEQEVNKPSLEVEQQEPLKELEIEQEQEEISEIPLKIEQQKVNKPSLEIE
jgi:hypothetical protein